MTGQNMSKVKRINKAKKNFYRFFERLLEMLNVYFGVLVSKEDLKEISYLHDLIFFLANKNINFDIGVFFNIPVSSNETEKPHLTLNTSTKNFLFSL